ncbi:HAD family hydrolase [Oscillospiraceae bacterium MB08-C2-2]|nr:HAD family hydrolase [Oscillospiraceae bacterium MB08-C2-2]
MYKLAVFDLDGTLLNTLTDLAVACNYALFQARFPVHMEQAYKHFVGNGVFNLIKNIVPADYREDKELLERVKAYFDDYYTKHSKDYTAPYDGVKSMLRSLNTQGVKVAVLSNKAHQFTVGLVENYFPGLVDVVYGQRNEYPKKPDPTVVFDIMKELGATAEETIYIGDSGVDMQTAKNAGLTAVGVLWGFRDADELLGSGADILVEDIEALLQKIVDK